MPNAFLKLALLAAASLAGGCTVHRYSGSSAPPPNYASYGYSKPAYQDRYDYDNDYAPTHSSGKPVGGAKSKPAADDDKPKAEAPKRKRPDKKKPPKRRPSVDDDDGPRRKPAGDGPRRTTPTKPLDPSTIRGDAEPTDEVKPEVRPERKPTMRPQVKPKRTSGTVEVKPERKPTIQPRVKPERKPTIVAEPKREPTVDPVAVKPRRDAVLTTAPRRTH